MTVEGAASKEEYYTIYPEWMDPFISGPYYEDTLNFLCLIYIIVLCFAVAACGKHVWILMKAKMKSVTVTRLLIFKFSISLFLCLVIQLFSASLDAWNVEMDYAMYPARIISLFFFSLYANKLYSNITRPDKDGSGK